MSHGVEEITIPATLIRKKIHTKIVDFETFVKPMLRKRCQFDDFRNTQKEAIDNFRTETQLKTIQTKVNKVVDKVMEEYSQVLTEWEKQVDDESDSIDKNVNSSYKVLDELRDLLKNSDSVLLDEFDNAEPGVEATKELLGDFCSKSYELQPSTMSEQRNDSDRLLLDAIKLTFPLPAPPTITDVHMSSPGQSSSHRLQQQQHQQHNAAIAAAQQVDVTQQQAAAGMEPGARNVQGAKSAVMRLTLEAQQFAMKTPSQQKQHPLAEHLYPANAEMQGMKHSSYAGRITGMLLELDNLDLIDMLQDHDDGGEEFRKKVDEVVAVIKAHVAKEAASAKTRAYAEPTEAVNTGMVAHAGKIPESE